MKKSKVGNGNGKGKLAKMEKRDNSIDTMIARAIDRNVPVETMEKLLAMRTQLKQEYAKEEFNRAMSEFQAECPTIQKTKNGGQTKFGKVAYKYAPLESIVEQVKDLIKAHGFSYGIQTEMTEKTVKVFCTVKHIAGHSEISDVLLPLTTKTEIMSAPQVVAATITFGKRYAFCNAFGIMTGDEDIDGQIENEHNGVNEQKSATVSIPEDEKPAETKKEVKPTNPASEVLFNTTLVKKTETEKEKIADLISAIKKEAKRNKINIGQFDKILHDCGLGDNFDCENFDTINDLSVLENIYENCVKFAIKRKK